MHPKDFLKEIDLHDFELDGELYEELGIRNLSDLLITYHNQELIDRGMCLMCQVTKSTKDNLCPSCYEDFNA